MKADINLRIVNVLFEDPQAPPTRGVAIKLQTCRLLEPRSRYAAIGLPASLTRPASLGRIAVAPGQIATWSGSIGGFSCDGPCLTGLQVSGGGTLALTNVSNGFDQGTTVIGNSEVIASADGSLGPGSAAVHLGDASSGGTLGFASSFNTSRAIILGAGGGTLDTVGASSVTASGVISGSGSLTKAGTGTLTLTGGNTYSGATLVNAGALVAGSATAFGSSKSLFINSSATVDLNGFNQNFFSVTGGGGLRLSGGALLTLGADNSDSAIGGTNPITGTGGLGLSFYTNKGIGFRAEYRALPFSWNRPGFDSRGAGTDGKFPNLQATGTAVVDGKDQTFKWNQFVTIGVVVAFPWETKVSE